MQNALWWLASPAGRPQEEPHQGKGPVEEVVHIVLTFDRRLPHFAMTNLELVPDASDLMCVPLKNFAEWLLRGAGPVSKDAAEAFLSFPGSRVLMRPRRPKAPQALPGGR